VSSAAWGLLSAVLVALITAGSTALTWVLGRGARRVAQRVQEHDRWMENADKAYDKAEERAKHAEERAANAEKRAERTEEKCDQCNRKLDRVLGALYGLMEDVEEQIIPAMMLPDSDPRETRNAMRSAVQRAREKVSA
jgi:predicted Holliday junction resolvase-like endonuclease